MNSATAIIGDVHGCLDELQELVRLLHEQGVERIVLVGDLMDKGPDPVGCVQFAREEDLQGVLGNHEEKHLRWRRHEDLRAERLGYKNPMRPLPDHYRQDNEKLSDEDVAWLRGLPLFLRPAFGWIVVHGGLFPGISVEGQAADKVMRGKILRLRWIHKETGEFVPTSYDPSGKILGSDPDAEHWTAKYDGQDNVVYGHEAHSLSTVRVDQLSQASCYGIDTGCVHGGRLTALVLGSSAPRFVQVQARRRYCDPPAEIPA